jgi:hypothetical protein
LADSAQAWHGQGEDATLNSRLARLRQIFRGKT